MKLQSRPKNPLSLTPMPVTCLWHHHNNHHRKQRRITFTPEFEVALSLIYSFADLHGGSPKAKPLPLNESDQCNTPDTPSNSRSGTPTRLRRRRRKLHLLSTNSNPTHYPPSSRCRRCIPQSALAPGLPLKLRAGSGANVVATAKDEDTGPPRGCHHHAILA